jgi:hypothetical protein
MTTLEDVADVETVARPAARSPDTRPALKYLEMSGAVRISIDTTGRISSNKIRTDTVAIFWIREEQARPVVRLARRHAGEDRTDPETMLAALHQAAADLHVTLTPHATAMERATEQAARLNRFVDGLRRTGALKEFTKAYRRHRLAAGLRGEGFMSYANAELRLRRALIPLLTNGGQPAVGGSLFAAIFESFKPPKKGAAHDQPASARTVRASSKALP